MIMYIILKHKMNEKQQTNRIMKTSNSMWYELQKQKSWWPEDEAREENDDELDVEHSRSEIQR